MTESDDASYDAAEQDDQAPLLDAVEERVLGALMEKAATTPEYYPMSLNALTNACNQKTNRLPVVSFDDKTVARALESMRDKGYVRVVSGADQRVPKHRHVFDEAMGLDAAQIAILCELMIRGPQTVGELRGRASRMHPFDELSQVEAVLEALSARTPPAVARLPRQPGRKESRYAHLFAGQHEADADDEAVAGPAPEAAILQVRAENDRIGQLEQTVEQLQTDMAALREEFAKFRQQFD